MSEPAFDPLLSPTLRRFFGRMTTFIEEHPDQPELLLAQYPEWDADPARVGIYGRFIQEYVEGVLETVFAMVREALTPAAWEGLHRGYYPVRSADSWEINQTCRGFPAFVAAQARAQAPRQAAASALPAFVADLAAFEWAQFEAFAGPEELPAQPTPLTVNPTLQTLQLDWRIADYAIASEEREAGDPALPPAEQAPGGELTLVWRNPATLRVNWRAAGSGLLLALKIALEKIPPAEAAAATGASEAQILELLRVNRERGILLG